MKKLFCKPCRQVSSKSAIIAIVLSINAASAQGGVDGSINFPPQSKDINAAAFADTTQLIYLSGKGCDDANYWNFVISDGMRKGQKSKICVPSCWEQQGFGQYTYGRWYIKPGETPSTESGTYTYDFVVPSDWNDKIIEINFEGVMTDAQVWINGVSAGETHQGAFTPFSYDISDKVRLGKKNTLKVVVNKESADQSINAAERKADWWLFGGIYRPVFLSAKPRNHISRASIDARADGTVNIQLITNCEKGAKIKGAIAGLGERVAQITGDSCLVTLRFDNPKLWNPEEPNLYNLQLQLLDADGLEQHIVNKRIGFRTVDFRRGDGFYLNGTKLLIKGVNRHCFYPESGRTSSYLKDMEDIQLIKAMNANAIRSHYPPDRHLLDICDSLGILYLNELPGWQDAYSDQAGNRILKEMVVRDASHPCIFAWSNGNEGGFNYNLDSLYGAYDPQHRHVVHAWALWDGVDAHHYPAYQTGVGRLKFGQNVFMPTEFLHAQYDKGAGASLGDFWKNWRESPLFAGAFIWSWADEGVARSDRNGAIDTDGPNGPDGIVGPFREKEGSYWAVRDVWSPLQIEPIVINESWDGSVLVKNDYLYTDLSDCKLAYQWLSIESLEGNHRVVCSSSIGLPQALPGESRKVKLPVIDDVNDGNHMLRIDLVAPTADTVRTYTMAAFGTDAFYLSQQAPCGGKANLANLEREIVLSASGIECTFDKNTGCLMRVKNADREIALSNGPLPVGCKADFKSFVSYIDGDDAVMVAKYTGSIDSITWRMKPTGILEMDAILFNDRKGHGFEGSFIDENPRCVGLTFSYPEAQCAGMKWLGNGPYRVWRNRIDGTRFGLWENDYNNTITGELPIDSLSWTSGKQKPVTHLVYPEFKGFYANMYWAKIMSEESPFQVFCANDGLYLRVFTPQEPIMRRDGKPTMQSFPEGDISFLIDISPIQSYKPLTQLGPAAIPPTIRINPGDEGLPIRLRFDFR